LVVFFYFLESFSLLIFVCRPPVAWTAFTLNELSGLIPVFDHSILRKIPKVGCGQRCGEFGKHS